MASLTRIRWRCVDFFRGEILPRKLLFTFKSPNTDRHGTGKTYLGTDETPRYYWTMCHVNTVDKKLTYEDSLVWSYPTESTYIKDIPNDDDIENYSIITSYFPILSESGVHRCGENCSQFYPLQTCSSICGFIVMVITAIACLNPEYFHHLTTTGKQRNAHFPKLFFQTPTRFSKYFRLVVAFWVSKNSNNSSSRQPFLRRGWPRSRSVSDIGVDSNKIAAKSSSDNLSNRNLTREKIAMSQLCFIFSGSFSLIKKAHAIKTSNQNWKSIGQMQA